MKLKDTVSHKLLKMILIDKELFVIVAGFFVLLVFLSLAIHIAYFLLTTGTRIEIAVKKEMITNIYYAISGIHKYGIGSYNKYIVDEELLNDKYYASQIKLNDATINNEYGGRVEVAALGEHFYYTETKLPRKICKGVLESIPTRTYKAIVIDGKDFKISRNGLPDDVIEKVCDHEESTISLIG